MYGVAKPISDKFFNGANEKILYVIIIISFITAHPIMLLLCVVGHLHT